MFNTLIHIQVQLAYWISVIFFLALQLDECSDINVAQCGTEMVVGYSHHPAVFLHTSAMGVSHQPARVVMDKEAIWQCQHCQLQWHTAPSTFMPATVLRAIFPTSLICNVFCWHQHCLRPSWTLCWPTVCTYLPGKSENHCSHRTTNCTSKELYYGLSFGITWPKT
jgi:hypothetical protein